MQYCNNTNKYIEKKCLIKTKIKMLHNIMLFYPIIIILSIKMYTKKMAHNGTEA